MGDGQASLGWTNKRASQPKLAAMRVAVFLRGTFFA
jgi:hypothetical protein